MSITETTECWWCRRPSVRPLCPVCSQKGAARNYIKDLIRNGQKNAPKRDVRPAGQRKNIRQVEAHDSSRASGYVREEQHTT